MTGTHTAYLVTDYGRIRKLSPAGAAESTITDYGVGATWSSGATSNLFGLCLRAIGAQTAAAPGCTVDAANVGGRCATLDTDPWRALPGAMSKVATTAAEQTGQVDLVFGMRAKSDQTPGDYRASIVVEALAPSA